MQLITGTPDNYCAMVDLHNFKITVKNPLTGPISQDLHLLLAANIIRNLPHK